MSEDHDEAELRALFAATQRPPLSDPAFVDGVMRQVGKATARKQALLGALTWAAGAAAALLALADGGGIVADLSRALAHVDLPEMSGGALSLLLAAAAVGGAWLLAERD